MKRFLSFVLAILMVVGVLPILALSIGATGSEGTTTDDLQLVITEIMPNSVNFSEKITTWKAQMPELFSSCNTGSFYEPVALMPGQNANAYYVLNEGVYTLATGTVQENTVYYRLADASQIYNVFSFVEIYNAGTKSIDLYDYKLAYDPNSAKDGDSVAFDDLAAGGVKSSFRKAGFERVYLDYNTCLKGYYSFDGQKYVKYESVFDRAVMGGVYYRALEDAYFMTNPEQGLLEPGQCAVVWFYTYNDWLAGLSGEHFKAFYEWQCSQANTNYSYDLDFSDVLFLGVSANSKEPLSYGYAEGSFAPTETGSVYYGIVADSVETTEDTARSTDWESWAHWSMYAGTTAGSFLTKVTAEEAKTQVVGYYVKDEANDRFVHAAVVHGTANKNHTAVSGKTYYEWEDVTEAQKVGESDVSDFYVYEADAKVFVKPSAEKNTCDADGKALDEVSYYTFTRADTTVTANSTNVVGFFLYDAESNSYVRPSWEDQTCSQKGLALSALSYYKLNLDNDPIVVGETDVSSYFTYDQKTNTYSNVSLEKGTADEKGKAVKGVFYYMVDLSVVKDQDVYAFAKDAYSTNFLYGFDRNAVIKQGTAYTAAPSDPSPGILTNVQRMSLPGTAVNNTSPELVITEVAPNPVGTGAYEYVEIRNVSDHPINVFEYSFVMQTSAYTRLRYEFFNKVSTIVPGDYGHIGAASSNSHHYIDLPSNMNYDEGWIDPGEVSILWGYSSESFAARATVDSFCTFYNIDSAQTKVFMMDTNTATSYHSNLPNTGLLMYGLARNDKIGWTGEPYVSSPLLSPVTYGHGSANNVNIGVSLDACESFVLTDPVAVSFNNKGLEAGYAYQFVWESRNGSMSKLGSLLEMGSMVEYVSDNEAYFSNPCVDDSWLSSPGVLTKVQNEAFDATANGGRYIYHLTEFDNLGVLSTYKSAYGRLGLAQTGNAALDADHDANVTASANLLSVKNGQLIVSNQGDKVDYMLLTGKLPAALAAGDYVIEYSMTYAAGNPEGAYSGLLFGFKGESSTYASSIVKLSGDVESNVLVEGVPATLAANARVAVADGATLAEKAVKVRIEISAKNGIKVYVDDVLRSATASEAELASWAAFTEKSDVADIALVTTAGTAVTYDYISVYADSAPEEEDSSFSYIGELDDGRQLYFHNNIMGVPMYANAKITEAQTSAIFGESTKIAFVGEVDATYWSKMSTRFGAKASILTLRADDLALASSYTVEALDKAGVKYWIDRDVEAEMYGASYQLSADLHEIFSGYYTDAYTALLVLEFETVLGTVTLYSERGNSQSVKQMLMSATLDNSKDRTDVYCYDAGDGTWSRYTAAQRKYFADICKNAI